MWGRSCLLFGSSDWTPPWLTAMMEKNEGYSLGVSEMGEAAGWWVLASLACIAFGIWFEN